MVKIFEDKQVLREILERLYFEEKCSLNTIARILNVGHTTVWRWFKELGIPRRALSDAISLALSSTHHRPYNPSKDENTIIELNALIHTDFTKEHTCRKIRVKSATSHIGQIYFFNKIATSHNLMPVRCAPVKHYFKKQVPFYELPYEWRIYTHLDESFKGVINDNKIRYLESLKDDKGSLLLYFTRLVECDGWIEIRRVSCSKKAPYREKIYAYIVFGQKNREYIQRLGEIIGETFNVPVSYDYYKKRGLIELLLPVMDRRVKGLLRKMPMVHPERNLKRELALKYTGEEVTDDLLREINSAREAIRRLRDLTVELAEERYRLEKRKRVMTADELVEEVLKRYAERFNDYDVERYFRI